MTNFTIRPTDAHDRNWTAPFVADRWGSELAVAHGTIYRPHELPGFVAIEEDNTVGLITYHIDGDSCEIVTIDSLRSGQGMVTALIEAVKSVARKAGCRRLWLITTNDNTPALRFYQKRGFVLVAVHRNAVEASRRLKPEIPLFGEDGIPIRDEIELELFPTDES